MNVSRWLILILILVFSLVTGSIGCGEQAVTGPATASRAPSQPTVMSTISGEVSVLKAGTAEWKEASPGMALETGDRIKTGAGSNAVITFFEGSTIELAADTEISFTELGVAGPTDSTVIELWQQVGKTRNRVEKLVDPASRYEIETPAGAAVVRGSVGDVEVDRDGTTIITNIQGRWCGIGQGKEVCIPQGYYLTIIPKQVPGTPTPVAAPPAPTQTQLPPKSQTTPPPPRPTRPMLWRQTTVQDFESGISDNVTVVDVGRGDGTVMLQKNDCYDPSGALESSSHDCRRPAIFEDIFWDNQIPGSAELKFQIATNRDNSTWNFVGPDGTSATYYARSGTGIWPGHDGNRYIKYKAYFLTTACNETPVLKEVRITYR
ncbi:MAG: FecR domain-containing protein [Chloroflexota bacterium]|nr:MAG: FecR domain-containing protein [Chloroflexota bacterium]